jgi:S1-C subfamily serine protease
LRKGSEGGVHRLFVVFAAVSLLAAAAIAHATAGPPQPGVTVVSVESRGLRAATGFVASDGRVVTVAHAVGDGSVFVRGSDGESREARVVRRDEELDLALLAASGLDYAAAPALGGPRLVVRRDGATTTVPVDVVRHIDARVRDAATDVVLERPALELSAAIGAGDSGAPVIGADGRVAGVIFARSRDREGIAYAVDGDALEAFLR